MQIFQKNKIKNFKAFTLIEILVVIAIIWLMAILSLNISFDSQTDTLKLDKLINSINSLINKELINIRSWKWIKVGTDIINPQKIYISMNTGSIISNYYSWDTLIWTWDIIEAPFYWDEFYEIKDFKYEEKNSADSWEITPLPLIIILENNNTIYFSWYTDSVKINFSVWYKDQFKKIYFDKRNWIINIIK